MAYLNAGKYIIHWSYGTGFDFWTKTKAKSNAKNSEKVMCNIYRYFKIDESQEIQPRVEHPIVFQKLTLLKLRRHKETETACFVLSHTVYDNNTMCLQKHVYTQNHIDANYPYQNKHRRNFPTNNLTIYVFV